jgi:PKD repeat protein
MTPSQRYKGFSGGLYPNGTNVAPAAHDAVGVARASIVTPLDTAGDPSPNGKIVFLSVGLSNTSLEFCGKGVPGLPCDPWTFMAKAEADPEVNHSTLVLVNGAAAGEEVTQWDDPGDTNYDRVMVTSLIPQGLTEAQVQVVLLKDFDSVLPTTPLLPQVTANAILLEIEYGQILRALKLRYPNLRQCFLTSRAYGGFAEYPFSANPEPWAYETGFAVKWVIEDQIDQMAGQGQDDQGGNLDYGDPEGPDFGVAPWVAWTSYLWAAGTTPRSDGFFWTPEDFEQEGGDRHHPTPSGAEKVADLWMEFFKTSPYTTPWFLESSENLAPIAQASATPTTGSAPLFVSFSPVGSEDPDGTITDFTWHFGDGATSGQSAPLHTYLLDGTYDVTLRVVDNDGARATDTITITVSSGTAAGRVPDGRTGTPLRVGKGEGTTITLSWSGSCMPNDVDYEIYEGRLGDFSSHEKRYCTTEHATSKTFSPHAGNGYYLVVPTNGDSEGSYGLTSSGSERPQAASACLPQQIGTCP